MKRIVESILARGEKQTNRTTVTVASVAGGDQKNNQRSDRRLLVVPPLPEVITKLLFVRREDFPRELFRGPPGP